MAGEIFTESPVFEPWWWEAAPRGVYDAALPKQTDVAVVGAGFAGLSAALTLSRAGRSVLVLDAESPGYGASSRNGGMIGSGHRRGFADLSKAFGEAKARDFITEGLRSLEFTRELIEREGIDCKLDICGRFRAAWRSQDYDTLARDAEFQVKEFGAEMSVVTRAEQSREVGTDRYHGGVIFHQHGGLHPGLFHAGLCDLAEQAGAVVAGHAAVTRLAREGDGFRLETVRGTVTARDVVIATNGYTGQVTQKLRRGLVPVSSYIVATEPLGDNRMKALIPGGRMIVETRSRHCYYRASPDGERLIFGCRAALRAIDPRTSAETARKLIVDLFPTLKDVKLSHSWSGRLGMTRQQLPHVGRHDGLHVALGFNGSGVAMAPYLGHKAALKVLGDAEGRTPFEETELTAVPFYDGRPWFLPFMDLYYDMKDRMEGPGG